MDEICTAMSRKTRTRQTRIHAALQSGYCAICHIPYNSLDDHIQSKKHLKLIGEDANYISINGFIDQNSLVPFLNLNGIDSIDINGKQVEKDFCPRLTRNTRNKGICEMLETTTPSTPIHRLRSRKQINYALSPSLDEDSLSGGEKLETVIKTPVKEKKNNNNDLLKNLTPSKPQFLEDDPTVELWNSGRPKRRSCIKAKRASADERLVVDNKIYYKVEVLSTKLRSSSHLQIREPEIVKQPEIVKDDKGLIVKFKKMRNSELTLLNNEAENFLFPKKDESSSEDENEDVDRASVKCQRLIGVGVLKSDPDDFKLKHETEDDASMDSTSSSGKRRKRRTHAEAFIMDNQKYYKFETPGSRLRYHGCTFFPTNEKPKNDVVVETIKEEDKKNKFLDLERYQFSFETTPTGEKWYEPFRRQDLGEESYVYLPNDGGVDRLILPYQMDAIHSLDPKICIAQYAQLKRFIREQQNGSSSGSRTSCSTPESAMENYTTPDETMDEDDSKSSENCQVDVENCGENGSDETRKRKRQNKAHLGGKNPRKSPRQHASTLAILSSLLQQRKPRKSKGCATNVESKQPLLPTIPEQETIEDECQKTTIIGGDYEEILTNIENYGDHDSIDVNFEFGKEEAVDFSNKLDILDVLRIHDEIKMRDDHRTNRRFINGTPGRKPGRRKKLNKTGWPNRKKGIIRGGLSREKCNDVELNTTENNFKNKLEINENCDLNRVKVTSATTTTTTLGKKFKLNKCAVKVTRIPSNETVRVKKCVVRRTNKRKMPASPKSPRMLRKPRGKWYKER